MNNQTAIVKRYLDNARAKTSGFRNADGMFSSAGNFGGRNAFRNTGDGFGPYSNADGGAVQVLPTSMPYTINITSASGGTVSNFDFLNANVVLLDRAKWSAGSYTDSNITISSGTPGVTYEEMLVQFQQQPFYCAETYINTQTAGQATQTLTVTTKDANGMEQKVPITMTISPNQYQSGIIVSKMGFPVNGNTKATISQVLANAVIQYQLYPSDKVNTSAVLDGQSANRKYSDPGIIPAQEVVFK